MEVCTTRRHVLISFILLLIIVQTEAFWDVGPISQEKQKEIPTSKSFPCKVDESSTRSLFPPTSVHQLRPGDIDVVAAIGDSLSAASGAIAKNLYDVYTVDNRGMSWIAGGEKTWRQHLTLPNILKLYNKNLTGYSLGDGLSAEKNAQLNVAVAGAMDQDLPHEAVELVKRLRSDPSVDFKRHWKLISVWIGTNDLCSDYCYDQNQGVTAHINNIQATLDYLYQNVPRAFVMLVSSPYIPSYAKLKDVPSIGFGMLRISCSCLFGRNEENKLKNVTITTRLFQRSEKQLAESGRYEGREDFTVQFQPTFLDAQFPTKRGPDGRITTDYSYLSVDCFHYSQKLHALTANTIWNNLFEPPWDKTTTWRPLFQRFLCPTTERPYLVTRQNSATWRQGRRELVLQQ